jgi:peptide/nickel transport system permease protein
VASTIFRFSTTCLKVGGGFLTVLALIIFMTVALQHLRQGSAEEAMMGQRGTAESLKKIQDKSFPLKLGEFVSDLPALASWTTLRGTRVLPQIGNALGHTAFLTFLSLFFSVGIGLSLLFLAERYPRLAPALERMASAINTTPIFLVGIFFIWLFAFALRLLPSGGDQEARAYILPALSIAVKFGSRLYLLLCQYMTELSAKVFVLRARAAGLGERRIFLHKLANCLMPFLIFWLIETASLFSGAVITEALFSIHGLGSLLIFALLQYDIRLIFANLAVMATIVYTTSLLQNLIANGREGRI